MGRKGCRGKGLGGGWRSLFGERGVDNRNARAGAGFRFRAPTSKAYNSLESNSGANQVVYVRSSDLAEE